MKEYIWVGSEKHYVDEIHSFESGRVTVGHFGGNSSQGQSKNEDGCLLWVDEEGDWEFAIILDAHDTAQSAELVLSVFSRQKDRILNILDSESENAFTQLTELILHIFKGESFQEACKTIQGETACLFAVRKENYLYWFSVGDCILHLYHPELARLGEYQQNHRSFFEWVGQQSTFNKSVPCYSTGIKELRKGENHIFLTTDGLTGCPGGSYHDPSEIFTVLEGKSIPAGVEDLLKVIQSKGVKDSTTILSWKVENYCKSTYPSNYPGRG